MEVVSIEEKQETSYRSLYTGKTTEEILQMYCQNEDNFSHIPQDIDSILVEENKEAARTISKEPGKIIEHQVMHTGFSTGIIQAAIDLTRALTISDNEEVWGRYLYNILISVQN